MALTKKRADGCVSLNNREIFCKVNKVKISKNNHDYLGIVADCSENTHTPMNYGYIQGDWGQGNIFKGKMRIA